METKYKSQKRGSSKVGMLYFFPKNNEYVCVGPLIWYANGGILWKKLYRVVDNSFV